MLKRLSGKHPLKGSLEGESSGAAARVAVPLEASFPAQMLVAFFKEHDLVYTRDGSSRFAAAFTFPSGFAPFSGEKGGFHVVFEASGPVCYLLSWPLEGTRLQLPTTSLVELCNRWNLERRLPRAAAEPSGAVRVDLSLDFGRGISQDHVSRTCCCMIGGTRDFLEWLACELPARPELLPGHSGRRQLAGYL